MKYMLLIIHSEADTFTRSEADQMENMQGYFALNTMLEEKGIPFTGEGLQPIASTTEVTVRNGEMLVSDGPFAETKEQLGGYYVVDVESIEKAHEIAAMIPDAKHGRVVVRPIMTYEG